MSLINKMLFLIIPSLFLQKTALAGSSGFRTGQSPGLYYTPLVKTSDLSRCPIEKQRQVMSPDSQILLQLCPLEYSKCMFAGSCLVEVGPGEQVGLSYYKYNETVHQSYFQKTDLGQCPYGYGYGKVSSTKAGLTCLIPYFAISADPLEHILGEVLFIPALQGLTLPDGQIHDGYFIISDSSLNAIDTGFDQFDFFTGPHSLKDPQNAFLKSVLSHPDKSFQYKIVTGKKADEIRKKRNFKILKVRNGQFTSKRNEMIGQ